MNLAIKLVSPFNSIIRSQSSDSTYSSSSSSTEMTSSSPSLTVPLYFDHTVSTDSETLRSIAVRFDITLAELRQTNRLSSFDTIFKGKILKIPNIHNYTQEKFNAKYKITEKDEQNDDDLINFQTAENKSLQNYTSSSSKLFEKRSSIHDLLNTDLLSFQTSNLSLTNSKIIEPLIQEKEKLPEPSLNPPPSQNQSIEEDAGFIKTHAILLPSNISGSLIITDSALMFDPDDRTDQDSAVINPLSEIAWMECVKSTKSLASTELETNKKLEAEFGRMNSLLRSISDYLLDEDSSSDKNNFTFLLLKMSIDVEFQYFEISMDYTNKIFNLLSDAKDRESEKTLLQKSLKPSSKTEQLSCYKDFKTDDLQQKYPNMQTNWFLQSKTILQQVQKNYEEKLKSYESKSTNFPGLIDHDYVVVKETNNSFEFPSIENFDEEYILPDLKRTTTKNPSVDESIDLILSDLESEKQHGDCHYHLKVLTKWLPDSVAGVSVWRLIFDSEKQGHSLASIYRICDKEKRKQMNNVLIIESVDGDFFGAFLTELQKFENKTRFWLLSDSFFQILNFCISTC